MPTCPSCGVENRPGCKFCMECGGPLDAERAALAQLVGDEAGRLRELREAQRLLTEIGAPIRAEQVPQELGT